MTYPYTLSQIRVRDPFFVCEGGRYYLVFSNVSSNLPGCAKNGVSVLVSEDLEHFSAPIPVFTPPEGFWADRDFWAPEIHRYRGKWYLFLSLKSETRRRGTQIFVSESFCPEEGMNFTPRFVCSFNVVGGVWLDGTLFEEGGVPYMVFCHEWVQVRDGEICFVPLTQDLRAPAGAPQLLFRASDAPWVQTIRDGARVTDGPFLYRGGDGGLYMLWSSFGAEPVRYQLAAARSESGTLAGPWRHSDPLLYGEDGGHGMLFTDLQGQTRLCLHSPNRKPHEHIRIFYLTETDGILSLREEI